MLKNHPRNAKPTQRRFAVIDIETTGTSTRGQAPGAQNVAREIFDKLEALFYGKPQG